MPSARKVNVDGIPLQKERLERISNIGVVVGVVICIALGVAVGIEAHKIFLSVAIGCAISVIFVLLNSRKPKTD